MHDNAPSHRRRWNRLYGGSLALLALGLISCWGEDPLGTAGEPSESSEPSEIAPTAHATPSIEGLRARVEELQNQLADQQSALEKLRNEKNWIEQRLPRAIAVEPGDTHWQIGYEFLTLKKGLEPAAAEQLLAEASLFEPVLEGFQAWNFYDGEVYGSFLTQGEAPVSPGTLTVRAREELERARKASRLLAMEVDELERQEAGLAERIERLENETRSKTSEIDSLRSHLDVLGKRHDELRAHAEGLQTQLHSVYYLAGTEAQLRSQGKLEDSILGGLSLGGNIGSRDFEGRIDLRQKHAIELRAQEYGVNRIEHVRLLPDEWKENRDYRVSIANDGKSATIELLDEDRFRLKSVVILLRS